MSMKATNLVKKMLLLYFSGKQTQATIVMSHAFLHTPSSLKAKSQLSPEYMATQ